MSNGKDKNDTDDLLNKDADYVKTYSQKDVDDYGYYFYPNRSPGKVKVDEMSTINTLKNKMFYGVTSSDTARCRINVRECATKHPEVQLMLRALEAHGCPVDLQRHVQCEPCKHKVTGGFDSTTNQVVICSNIVKRESMCCNVLAHELVHAFDKCRAKLDMTNLEHIACTEIRAANLMHCGLLSAVMAGDTSPTKWKNSHQNCVKNKALGAVLLVRNVEEEKAKEVVEKVFDKCYKDLEPIGRRLRRRMGDADQALKEGLMFGYTPCKAEKEAWKYPLYAPQETTTNQP